MGICGCSLGGSGNGTAKVGVCFADVAADAAAVRLIDGATGAGLANSNALASAAGYLNKKDDGDSGY